MTLTAPRVSIVMRSYNDIDTIEDTLRALKSQTFQDFELWNHDSSSSDGTLQVLLKHNDHCRVLVNDPARYVPGKVLNKAVSLCRGEIIVFLNSDATPNDSRWLENLIRPLEENESVGAAYGRQATRKDCRTLFYKDTERAFGDGSISANWVHFFSMANSAARKAIFADFPFSEEIQFSEDIEWSLRLTRSGYDVTYVPDAIAVHSHNYSLQQSYQRHFGEGQAEAEIFTHHELDFGFTRYALLPFGMEVLRDVVWSIKSFSLDGLMHTVPLRFAQKFGRWKGLRAGLAQ